MGMERTWLRPRPGTLPQIFCVLLGLASGPGDRDLGEAFLPLVGGEKRGRRAVPGCSPAGNRAQVGKEGADGRVTAGKW